MGNYDNYYRKMKSEEKSKRKNKVFLGGTCNKSTWRNKLIPLLECDYFNPVVEEWNDNCYENEVREKNESKFHLFLITPLIEGYLSIAEVVESTLYSKDVTTVFMFIENDIDEDGELHGFTEHQIKSLKKVGEIVENHGGIYVDSTNFQRLANLLNNYLK